MILAGSISEMLFDAMTPQRDVSIVVAAVISPKNHDAEGQIPASTTKFQAHETLEKVPKLQSVV